MMADDHFVCHVTFTTKFFMSYIPSKGVAGFPHTSKMENFETIINGWNPLIIFAKPSISDALGVLTTPLLFIAASAC